jgi:hypothetical protein
MPRTTQDLSGQRFARLEVIERDYNRKGAAYWRVRCDCGTELSVTSQCLRTGHTRSCGCLRREVTIARSTKHGLMTRDGKSKPTYNSWSNMIRRCTNPTHDRWEDYGGRGIKVCERWRDYPAFLEDMGEKPLGTTLDRIDNDNYEPGNCRWETHAKQNRNKRRFKLTSEKVLAIRELHGQRLPVGTIAAMLDIRRHTVGTVCITLDALADL